MAATKAPIIISFILTSLELATSDKRELDMDIAARRL